MPTNAPESVRGSLNGWRMLAATAALGFSLLPSGCASNKITPSTEQVHSTTQAPAMSLTARDLQSGGVAFITPSSVTGQEEDRGALALAFAETLRTSRPDLRCVTLPETLSAINRADLATEYKRMFDDSRLTGVFDREILQKIARVTGVRYLAQLKLGAFRQDAKGRLGVFGFRVAETKSAFIRLFLQIWDSQDGAIVWEGSQEMTIAHESVAEDAVSLQRAVEASAREILMRLPAPATVGNAPADPERRATQGSAPTLGSAPDKSHN
jgi:hypothetical protein